MTEQYPPPGESAYRGTGPATAESTAPLYSDRPVALRGPETLGGLLLILAGLAAGISLLLDWLATEDISGWGLVRRGFENLESVYGNGMWQPLAIVLGGGVLFLLGVLMWLPMRSHRLLGFLGLLVSLAVVAGILVPLVDAQWDLGAFGIGFWFGIAVAVLGLVGSIKALLTGPKYG
jgi:hypothetical protein